MARERGAGRPLLPARVSEAPDRTGFGARREHRDGLLNARRRSAHALDVLGEDLRGVRPDQEDVHIGPVCDGGDELLAGAAPAHDDDQIDLVGRGVCGEALGGAHPAVPLGAEDPHVEAVPAQRDTDHLRPHLVDGVAHHHDPGGDLRRATRARPVNRLEDVLEGAHQDTGRGAAGDLAVRAGADLLQRRGDETAPRVDETVLGHR